MTTSTIRCFITLIFATSSWGRKDVWKIGYFASPTGVLVESDARDETKVTGYFVDLVRWIAAYNKINLSLVQLEYRGNFTAIANEITTKGIDLALPAYGATAVRNELARYVFPVDTSGDTLILPYPKRENDPWSCLKPFTLNVWLCVVACIVVMPFILKFIASVKDYINSPLHRSESSSFTSLTTTSAYVLGVITNQGGYLSQKTRSFRLIAGIWCLAALVLVNAYSSLLITYLTAPVLPLLVNSIEDLARRDSAQLLVVKGSFSQIQLSTADGTLKSLRNNIARLPDDFCGTIWEPKFDFCLKRVENGGHVLAVNFEVAESNVNVEFGKTKKCTMTYLQNTYSTHLAGFIVPLNATHEFRNAFDIGIMRAFSHGLYEKFQSNYFTDIKAPCVGTKPQNQELRKLSLVDFTSAFVLLGTGYGISFIVLVYEIAMKRTSRKT